MNIDILGVKYKENVSSKYLSTYRGGGVIRYVCFPTSIKELREIVNFAFNAELPFFILGNGSNILVKDVGYKGIAISLIEFNQTSLYNNYIYSGAGVKLKSIYEKLCLANSLSGFERLQGIPSSVGGAIIGNAGAYGAEIGDIVEYVDILDIQTLNVKRLKKQDLEFKYRGSILKESNNVVLGAYFKLEYKPLVEIEKEAEKVIKLRKERQPKLPSLGSVFVRDGDIIPAKLIDACGLKGYTVGGSKISEVHANFIVNTGGGTASDYIKIMEKAESMVQSEFGVSLTKEIRIL